MIKEDTNIISDEDFLKEILQEVKAPEPKEELSEMDKLLMGDKEADITKPLDTKETSQEGVEPKEDDTPSAEDIEKEEKSSIKRFGVKDTISTLIENGFWADMPIKYADKEYENIEELIEKEKPSKELFELLSQAQKKFRDDQIDSTYVKIGDKSSTKAKLVNAILNDVEYSDLLEYNKDVVEPLQRVDFANIDRGDQIAEAFVRQCLVDIDNYHPDSIDAVVANMKKNFQLLEKAEEYQRVTIENFNQEIERRESEKRESIQKNRELEKESMKALREETKNQNINDSMASKILKLRYTKDPNSDKYHYQELIEDRIKKDKSYEARLMYFLLDDKDFIEKEKSKVKLETQKTYLELVDSAPKSAAGHESKKKGNLQTDDEDFLREIGLISD